MGLLETASNWRKKGLLQRFWEKVSVSGGPDSCWEWKAFRNDKGYGTFHVSEAEKSRLAHRVAFCLANGIDLQGVAHVLHSCDNPACCNPGHLRNGTHTENMQDKARRGRWNGPRGQAHHFRLNPELASRGHRHYSRTQPERLARGEGHGNSKLTAEAIAEILAADTSVRGTQTRLARKFGVSVGAVNHVVKGRNWKDTDTVMDAEQVASIHDNGLTGDS